MSDYMDKLIHVGFTNKYQLDYASEAEGAFYSDSDNECNIPLYMLSVHSMRASDSVVVETHDALVEQNKALIKVINEIRSMVTDVQDGFDVTGGDAEILDLINAHWSKHNES
tara:strand:- start:1329 stop:1664 length:336 start_codon:yes stop_codon:yes gene_type:complete